jgi:hypothetical protein
MAKPPCVAIVPSRERPGSIADLLDTFGDTAVCTRLVICLDDDDPQLDAYRKVMEQPRFARQLVSWVTGPRRGLAGWTNKIAAAACREAEALITLGDDHRPESPAWDREWLMAARLMGGGWVYGDDGVTHSQTPAGWVTSVLPSAFLVTSPIVAALGWMLGPPGCQHMFVDAAARDLALAASAPGRPRLAYLPFTRVRHDHYTTGRSARDATYDHGYASWTGDEAAYRAWLGTPEGTGQIAADADTVRTVCSPLPSP